jgi:hypothetical protein
MALADERDVAYRADWAELFVTARVRNEAEVVIDLRRSHVHPDGLLQTVVRPWYQRSPGSMPAALGPYGIHQTVGSEVRYRASQRYFAGGAAQPQEIIERHYPDGRTALAALRNGEIAVLDRVNPWDVERLQAVPYLVVQPYAVPTVHCLIPNPHNKLLARRTFRRCIESALNRQQILAVLLKGSQQPGNQSISGPFPNKASPIDTFGYAYDDTLPPRPYDRALAVTLPAEPGRRPGERGPQEAGGAAAYGRAAAGTAAPGSRRSAGGLSGDEKTARASGADHQP